MTRRNCKLNRRWPWKLTVKRRAKDERMLSSGPSNNRIVNDKGPLITRQKSSRTTLCTDIRTFVRVVRPLCKRVCRTAIEQSDRGTAEKFRAILFPRSSGMASVFVKPPSHRDFRFYLCPALYLTRSSHSWLVSFASRTPGMRAHRIVLFRRFPKIKKEFF